MHRELGSQATSEISRLTAPSGSWADRETREVYSVDATQTVIREDGFTTSQARGLRTLHVSMPDLGLISQDSPIAQGAWRPLTQNQFRKLSPALLQRLCLSTKEERPALTVHVPVADRAYPEDATFSRELVRIKETTTFQEVRAMQEAGEANIFTDLYAINGDIDPKPSADLNEAMVQITQRAAAAYMRTHGIPGIFLLLSPADQFPSQSQLSLEPRPQERLSDIRAHFSSPILHYPAYINHSNFIAHLENRPSPFPKDQLTGILRSLVKADTLQPPHVTTIEEQLYSIAQVPDEEGVAKTQFRQALATALFSPLIGEATDIANLRQAAFRILAESSIRELNEVINAARNRGWIQIMAHESDRKQLTHGQKSLVYPTSDNKAQLQQERLECIRYVLDL